MPTAPPTFSSRPKGQRYTPPERERGSAVKRGYGRRWREARLAFLRANPLCAEHAKRQQTAGAVLVDHIIPHKGDLDLFWDQTNWQSLCKPCHDRKTAIEDGGFGREVAERFVVCGPPCGGKSTWVREHRRPGDLVWDLDEIVSTMTGLPIHERDGELIPLMRELRETLVDWLVRSKRKAYLIVTRRDDAEDMAASIGARLVVIDPGFNECLRRLNADRDGRFAGVEQVISAWYETKENSGGASALNENESNA